MVFITRSLIGVCTREFRVHSLKDPHLGPRLNRTVSLTNRQPDLTRSITRREGDRRALPFRYGY